MPALRENARLACERLRALDSRVYQRAKELTPLRNLGDGTVVLFCGAGFLSPRMVRGFAVVGIARSEGVP